MNKNISKSKIRSQFLCALSKMYSEELPEYRQFVDIVSDSNRQFIKKNPNIKVDNLNRVLEERHGAIRVGTASEMRIVSRIFSCLGMEPVNFYDLTKVKKPMPVISTAFRPKTTEEINQSAFRMFVSMLFLDDERFFNDKERQIARQNLAKRKVFDDELLEILDLNEKQGGLDQTQADLLVKKAAQALRMDHQQIIDFELYKKFIINGNDVAADIICFKTIHINHLTPRVYDIFDVHKKLQDQSIPTIEEVQGPPKRDNEQALPLLHQTSRKAPGEFVYASIDKDSLNQNSQTILELEKTGKIPHIEPQEGESVKSYLDRIEAILQNTDTKIVALKHKARFGEIECRGVALTPKGRDVYDQMVDDGSYVDNYPKTHFELAQKGYAYYQYFLIKKPQFKADLIELVKDGYVGIMPITYEDFLPKSAAGIFESNLSGKAKLMDELNTDKKSNHQDILEAVIGKKIVNSYDLYSDIESQSKQEVLGSVEI